MYLISFRYFKGYASHYGGISSYQHHKYFMITIEMYLNNYVIYIYIFFYLHVWLYFITLFHNKSANIIIRTKKKGNIHYPIWYHHSTPSWSLLHELSPPHTHISTTMQCHHPDTGVYRSMVYFPFSIYRGSYLYMIFPSPTVLMKLKIGWQISGRYYWVFYAAVF